MSSLHRIGHQESLDAWRLVAVVEVVAGVGTAWRPVNVVPSVADAWRSPCLALLVLACIGR